MVLEQTNSSSTLRPLLSGHLELPASPLEPLFFYLQNEDDKHSSPFGFGEDETYSMHNGAGTVPSTENAA